MALTKCPDCGREVSTAALSCPGCGRPFSASAVAREVSGGRACPHCGSHAVGKVRGMQGPGEVLICITLFFAFIIPGIVYYVWREATPYCSGCGRRV